jgi:hypothetical protein
MSIQPINSNNNNTYFKVGDTIKCISEKSDHYNILFVITGFVVEDNKDCAMIAYLSKGKKEELLDSLSCDYDVTIPILNMYFIKVVG